MSTTPKNNHPLLGSGKVKEVTAILTLLMAGGGLIQSPGTTFVCDKR